jgi:23S rRNA (cytidine1920-2'-O)/16S rRNA (cytidine1409-2'-O)-methyltransferase
VKQRADVLLVERGLAESRGQAQRLLMAGLVYLGEQRLNKPGERIDAEANLSVRQQPRFVSRGGDKLDAAMSELNITVSGCVCVDIGAATGGFTDCLLQRGASRVYAVDVGHGQLSNKLRQDPRVVNWEGINARTLTADCFPDVIDWLCVDASFIAIDRLIGAFARILSPGRHLLALIKPQFEVGREQARRSRGVVRDAAVRAQAIERARAVVVATGFELLGACDSSLRGPKGNLEHFLLARRTLANPP